MFFFLSFLFSLYCLIHAALFIVYFRHNCLQISDKREFSNETNPTHRHQLFLCLPPAIVLVYLCLLYQHCRKSNSGINRLHFRRNTLLPLEIYSAIHTHFPHDVTLQTLFPHRSHPRENRDVDAGLHSAIFVSVFFSYFHSANFSQVVAESLLFSDFLSLFLVYSLAFARLAHQVESSTNGRARFCL